MDRVRAKRFFEYGLQYWKSHNPYDAMHAWMCSYKLVPNRHVAFNIGMAAEKMKIYTIALRFYRLFLRETKDPAAQKPALARIKVVEEKLTLIEGRDGHVKWPEYRPPPGTTAAVKRCPHKTGDLAQDRKNAGYWYKMGLRHFQSKQYISAMSAWMCSDRIVPHYLAAYNVARAAELAKKYFVAKKYYQEYLLRKPDAADRAKVQEAIARVKAMAMQRERLRNEVHQPVYERAPRARPIQPTTPPVPVVRRHASRSRRIKRVLGWISVAGAGALGIAAASLAGLAVKARDTVDHASSGTPWTDLASSYDNYYKYSKAGWATMGIGAALLTTGIVLLVLDRKERPRVTAAPALGPGGASFTISGQF